VTPIQFRGKERNRQRTVNKERQILCRIERNYEFTFEEFVRLQLLAANQIQAVMSVREEGDSHVRSFVMSKRTNHIPPALKHGIYRSWLIAD
jgi:hypothetical protein